MQLTCSYLGVIQLKSMAKQQVTFSFQLLPYHMHTQGLADQPVHNIVACHDGQSLA